ncbi:MAG: hypothetical protein H6760_04280 [Candidatus Nomurabacteria bacterium]|nr:MAG: hypothetical protein H6760_04280 [Candidatus Nomurabacteria bacterium]
MPEQKPKSSVLSEALLVLGLVGVFAIICAIAYIPNDVRKKEAATIQTAQMVATWAGTFARENEGLYPHTTTQMGRQFQNAFGGEEAVLDGEPPHDRDPGACYYVVSRDRHSCTIIASGKDGRELLKLLLKKGRSS